MSKVMPKIARGSLRSWAIGTLQTKQGGLCPLCMQPICMQVKGSSSDYVVDHDHDTGEIRGVLHRSCNAAEGKVANAVGKWGSKSMDKVKRIAFMKRLITYLESEGCGAIYPNHKTVEERAIAAKHKAKVAAARRRAAKKARG